MPRGEKATAEGSAGAVGKSDTGKEGADGMGYWLMKAEPDSRLEKGVDVAFSIDHFERDGTTSWEGVRNPLARNHMKNMKLGDRVLFYHSNCKIPGVAGLAEVCKLAYPDHSAWDPKHPYYDAKTDKENPKWYMVDLKFSSRLDNLIPLGLLRDIADLKPSDAARKEELGLSDSQIRAIKEMPLLSAARLSVQPASKEAYDAITQLSKGGAWQSWTGKWNPGAAAAAKKTASAGVKSENREDVKEEAGASKAAKSGSAAKDKRKVKDEDEAEEEKPSAKEVKKSVKKEARPAAQGTRRSTRTR